jgi:hypothetical protein
VAALKGSAFNDVPVYGGRSA